MSPHLQHPQPWGLIETLGFSGRSCISLVRTELNAAPPAQSHPSCLSACLSVPSLSVHLLGVLEPLTGAQPHRGAPVPCRKILLHPGFPGVLPSPSALLPLPDPTGCCPALGTGGDREGTRVTLALSLPVPPRGRTRAWHSQPLCFPVPLSAAAPSKIPDPTGISSGV